MKPDTAHWQAMERLSDGKQRFGRYDLRHVSRFSCYSELRSTISGVPNFIFTKSQSKYWLRVRESFALGLR